ncbi:MAG: Asp-tRNA(Asn)/Glu-tRNA(Gln) amidotransferase subunit GatA [Armatimonadetes bacterium]|nr:Asp-tRNA(Asn)/Glu-tRNA(Gln) amidotransferase subunit GatA [Armatimonadota bacterium]
MRWLDEPYHRLRPRLGREVTLSELVDAALARIESREPKVRAFLAVTGDQARTQARAWSARLAAGEPAPPLLGMTMALKDNLCTRGIPTTCGSRMLARFVPPYDATVTARLAEAGAILVGKTNLDEFAMGSSTENSAFGPSHNPWDQAYAPGGSSGGSAVAVAAREAMAALGSDTGGSVRLPAALCGAVGLKPTYGRVSRYGLVAFASSLDQVGPITRDVTDCALVLNVIAGRDELDSTSAEASVPDFTRALAGGVAGLRIGLPAEFFGPGLDAAVKSSVLAAVRSLEAAGARVQDVSLPAVEYALPTYCLIACAEVSSNLARYDGVAYGHRAAGAKDLYTLCARTREEGFGAEAKRRIMLGTFALSAGHYEGFYRKAQQVRTLLRGDFERAFAEVDVIAGPVAPTPGFRLGEKTADPLQMYLIDTYTIPANLAGLPAISVPCGFAAGLPIGLQLIARAFDEATLLRAAFAVEQAVPPLPEPPL